MRAALRESFGRQGREDRAGTREVPGDEARPARLLHQGREIHLRLHRHRPGPPGGRAAAHDRRGAASLAGERTHAVPRRQRPRLRAGGLPAPGPGRRRCCWRRRRGAQEKKVSLIFTGELLSQIATDNQGEQTAEIVDRIIGLSPAVLNVRLQRASGRVSLLLTASGADDLPVSFQFTLDKMVYYRMRTARADVTGMTEALQEAKAAEPLLLRGRLPLRRALLDDRSDARPARGDQGGPRDAGAPRGAARAAAEAKAAADARAAEEARAAAAAKAAADAAAKAAAKAAEAARAPREAEARRARRRESGRRQASRAGPGGEAASGAEGDRPARPAKEATYLSARGLGREAAPVVDGQSSDAAWQAAPPFSFEVDGRLGENDGDRGGALVARPPLDPRALAGQDQGRRAPPLGLVEGREGLRRGARGRGRALALVRAGRADGRVHARGQRGRRRTCGPGAPGARIRPGSPRTRR